MDNYKIMTKVSGMLSEYLESIGINADVNFAIKPIEKTLRASWYVDKVKQCGHTDCIFVGVHHDHMCGSAFFVVLEDGSIMTGGNIFVSDVFQIFEPTWEGADFIMSRPHLFKLYTDEYHDNVCIITSLDGVRKFFDRLEPFIIEAEEIEAF